MSKQIRVLEAIRQGQVGGGETHVYDLSTRLDQSKFEPVVLSFTDGEMVDNLKAAGIETHVIHTTTPFDPRVVKQVKSLMKELEIDLVHAHGTRAASNTLRAARKLKLPLIYTVHGWSFNDSLSPIKHLLRRKTEEYITRRTTLNICVSHSNKEAGKEFLRGFDSEVIYNGISLDRFQHDIDCADIKREISKEEGQVWVGFLARMTMQKDPLTMVEAFALAQNENQALRMLMVGNGELDDEVQNRIDTLGLQDRIVRLPFRRDVPNLLATLDIYCLPSLWEGLPIGVIEAMAMKKPVIASKVDGTVELIGEGEGVLIPVRDPVSLSKAVLQLANNESLRRSMGESSFLKIQQHFLIESMVSKIEKHYSALLGL